MAEDAAQVYVEPPRFERAVSATDIGMNVAWFSGSRANNLVLFINQIKGARPWDDPFNLGGMRYDQNGYPTVIPGAYVVSQLLIRSADMHGIAPHDGRFRLYGQGAGTFSVISTARGVEVGPVKTTSLPSEQVNGTAFWYTDVDFTIDPGAEISQIKMQIHDLAQGNHIRNLALVHHSHLEVYRQGAVFAPELEQDLEVYGALRLMDWMRANRIEEQGDGWRDEGSDWSSPTPDQRYVSPGFYTFNNHAGGRRNEGRFEVSVPIEHIVLLANRTGADPWINLPVDITDARAAMLARYVAAHLDETLTARWEYGNELFNSAIGFEGYRYAIRMARARFGADLPEGPNTAVEWAAYRGPQLYNVVADAMAEHRRTARYVAPGWAFSSSLSHDGGLNRGYLVRYFNAAQSRAMNDGTPLPLDIVTDYAVAMYFGGTMAAGRPDAPVVSHILRTVDGTDAQAHKLADWLLFGASPDRFVHVTRRALETPLTDVPLDGDIGVAPLIAEDVAAGLNPLTDLAQVLRLRGARLQYRGQQSQAWRDVLVFQAPPKISLQAMIDQVRLVGHGGRLSGQFYSGLRSGLGPNTGWRLDAHGDYAKALGLNFVAYEGGSHLAAPMQGAWEMYQAFNTGTAGARVLARWLEIMSDKGLDEYIHFMSHNRTNAGDWWGVQDYIGQPIADSPEAQVLRQAIAAFDPAAEASFTGPLKDAGQVQVTRTGQLRAALPARWLDAAPWSIGPNGEAYEAAGDTRQLRLAAPLPIDPAVQYTFEFDVRLEDAAQADMRVVARVLGQPTAQLFRWQSVVQDGVHISLEVGPFEPGQKAVTIAVQRVGQAREGTLTLRNAQFVPQ
ncbi:MAG: hypothetical protein AAF218_05930 [Pseudomonadota bacterium]